MIEGDKNHPYFNKEVEIIDPEEIRKRAIERLEKREKIKNLEGNISEDNEEEKEPA